MTKVAALDFVYAPITFTRSKIPLNAGDIFTITAQGTADLNANRLIGYSYKFVKLT